MKRKLIYLIFTGRLSERNYYRFGIEMDGERFLNIGAVILNYYNNKVQS